MRQRAVAALLLAVALGACGDDLAVDPQQALDPRLGDASVEEGLRVDVVVDGLVGPTQFVVDGNDFVVAQINGGENDAQGQVIRVSARGGSPVVLVDGLDKPTGVAVVDGELWIMERDRLTRGPLGGERQIVIDDLPNNGRSEGTLTVLPDGRLLFDTSGSKRGSDVVDGSGRLFTVDPADPDALPVEYAEGFKHAYAHVVDDDGTLWTTEMTDGRFDDEPATDEVVAVAEGVDHGWPHCVGNNRIVDEFGGSAERCSTVPGSQAVFDPSATPTGIAVSPFEPDTLLVALWNERRIVALRSTESVNPVPVRTLVSDLDRPQHLVTVGDDVYVSDFGSGLVLRLSSDS